MLRYRQQQAAKSPSVWAHIGALGMPLVMAVLIPAWLLQGHSPATPSLTLRIIGVVLSTSSLWLFITTLWLFIRVGQGTLAPWDPTRQLIILGPYRYCRNPMISSVLGIIMGQAAFFASQSLLLWGCIFFIVNTAYFVTIEEPNLERKFGKPYVLYKHKVSRWLPVSRMTREP